MSDFYYVYILIDVATEKHYYVGSTSDLAPTLEHNEGGGAAYRKIQTVEVRSLRRL